MTLTRQKKATLKKRKEKIVKFKEVNGITKCAWCGYPIEKSPHHFLCRICWEIRQKTTKHNLKKAKEMRLIQVNKKSRNRVIMKYNKGSE